MGTTLDMANELHRTAVHEADHAVVAHLLHVKIRYVTIVPEEDSLGHVKPHVVHFGRHGVFDDRLKGSDRAERHIMVYFAGQLAQRKFAPRSRWRLGGEHDQKEAMDLFWHISHPDQKARNLQLALLWRKTECCVEGGWKEINAVAKALLARRTLTLDDVADVIDEAHGIPGLSANLRALGRRLKAHRASSPPSATSDGEQL